MFTGINLNETKKYISAKDPDKNNPTAFHIGIIDSFVKAHIEDSTTEYESSSSDPEADVKIKISYAMRNILTAKFGIRKIENFFDAETKQPIAIEAEEVKIGEKKYLALSDSAIAKMSKGGLISELALEILNLNKLSEQEGKN